MLKIAKKVVFIFSFVIGINWAEYEPFEFVPAPGKVVIDGKLDDWDLSGAYGPVSFDAEYVGKNDVIFYGMYDKERVYFGFHVNDPDPLINRGIVEEGNYWLGDSIEIRFSVNPKDGVPPAQDSSYIRHIAVWFNSDKNKVQSYIKSTMKYQNWDSTGLEAAFRKWDNGKGWDCELSVPWETLSKEVKPVAGDWIGGCIAVLFGNKTGTAFWRKVNVMASDINYQQTSEWRKPGFHFSPVGNIQPNPKTITKPTKIQKEPVSAVTQINYKLPRTGKVSLAVYKKDGKHLVRSLLFYEMQEKGEHSIGWDGYDDDGNPVVPGEYTWKIAIGDGIKAIYIMGLLNGGTPEYITPDGKGGWGGIWGNIVDVAADSTGVYVLWEMEEGQGALVKIDPSGYVLWKQHIPYALSAFQSCLASDGEYVVLASVKGLWRVKSTTGEYAPFTDKKPYIYIDGPTGWTVKDKEVIWKEVPESKYLKFLVGSAIHHITGITLGDGKIFISRLYENRIDVYDNKTAELVGNIPVNRPFGLEYYKGNVFVVSGKQVLKFSADTLKYIGVAIDSGLVAPYGLAIDSFGNFWVTDLGSSQQVKKFTEDGKLCLTCGRLGGRLDGKFINTDFLYPTGICVEPKTGQVFFGEDVVPKRLVALDSNGRFVRQWLGPYYQGNAAYLVDAKHKPVQFYFIKHASIIRFNIDLENNASEIDAVWSDIFPLYDFRRGELLYHNGKAYLCISCGADSIIYRVDDYVLKPCTRIGIIPYWHEFKGYRWQDGYRAYVWRDTNGNGILEENQSELVVYTNIGKPFHCGYWGVYFHSNFDIWGPGTGISLLPCLGFDKFGNPIYDWAKSEEKIAKLPVGSDETAIALDEEGNIYFSRERFYQPDRDKGKYPEPKGLDWAGRNTHADVSKIDPQGNPIWRVLKKTESFRKPGEVYALRGGIATRKKGCIFVDDCSSGQTYVISDDGLVLDELLEDVARGPAPSAYTLFVEHFTSYFFEYKNELYFVTGAEDIRIYRVTGFETYQRITGSVSFTEPVKPRIAEKESKQEFKAKCTFFKSAPNIDGNLQEWSSFRKEQITIAKEPVVEFAFGYDRNNLYAGFHIKDESPMKNNSTELNTSFKYGDSIEILLGCDPKAEIGRKEPVPGDIRLLITRYKGEPVVIAYRARVPGTKEPFIFTSPVNKTQIDKVELLKSVKLSVVEDTDGKGYTVELAVPFTELAPLIPVQGTKIGFDIGINFSDPGGQFNASKVFWTGREAMVRDIPTEVNLGQDKWGILEFE